MKEKIDLNLFKVILSPVITEKSTRLMSENQYVFNVARHATKSDVKKAIEMLFSVKVETVNTLIRKGKKKIFRGRPGMRQDVKKAFVKLAEGQKIEVGVGG